MTGTDSQFQKAESVSGPWTGSSFGGYAQEMSKMKREQDRAAKRPTLREWLKRTQQAKPTRSKRSGAQLVRELRDGR